MSERELPELTEVPILHMDMTPDAELPLRILRAYRANCECRWITNGLPPERARVYEIMNEVQVARIALLDAAIQTLAMAPK